MNEQSLSNLPKIKTETFSDIRPVYGDITGQTDLRVPGRTAEECYSDWLNKNLSVKIISAISRLTYFGNLITVYYIE